MQAAVRDRLSVPVTATRKWAMTQPPPPPYTRHRVHTVMEKSWKF